jgi:hypothetical protein
MIHWRGKRERRKSYTRPGAEEEKTVKAGNGSKFFLPNLGSPDIGQ